MPGRSTKIGPFSLIGSKGMPLFLLVRGPGRTVPAVCAAVAAQPGTRRVYRAGGNCQFGLRLRARRLGRLARGNGRYEIAGTTMKHRLSARTAAGPATWPARRAAGCPRAAARTLRRRRGRLGGANRWTNGRRRSLLNIGCRRRYGYQWAGNGTFSVAIVFAGSRCRGDRPRQGFGRWIRWRRMVAGLPCLRGTWSCSVLRPANRVEKANLWALVFSRLCRGLVDRFDLLRDSIRHSRSIKTAERRASRSMVKSLRVGRGCTRSLR